LHAEVAQSKKPLPINFDYKLFVGSHVPDIVIPKGRDIPKTSGTLPNTTRDEVLAELMEV
jgi:hypothetical protein